MHVPPYSTEDEGENLTLVIDMSLKKRDAEKHISVVKFT